MRFDQLLIGFLILSGFMIGGGLMITSMNDPTIGVNMSSEKYGEIYNKTAEIANLSNEAKQSTLEGDIEGGADSWESMTKGSYAALRLIPRTYQLFADVVNAIASELGIPSVFIGIAMTVFILTIIFGVVYMIFRYLPNS